MFNATSRAAAPRATTLQGQAPDQQKARLDAYLESQAAVKRKLEGTSASVSSSGGGISGSSAMGGPSVEVVVVNDKFGIRLTDVVTPSERLKRLSKG